MTIDLDLEKIAREAVACSVIEGIRAEIAEEINDYQAIGEKWSDDTAYGLQLALDIIDKHLKG